jgi:hypothetical protein
MAPRNMWTVLDVREFLRMKNLNYPVRNANVWEVILLYLSSPRTQGWQREIYTYSLDRSGDRQLFIARFANETREVFLSLTNRHEKLNNCGLPLVTL